MIISYEIREICGDWAIWQQYETDQGSEEKILLILNSRSNAEYIKAILEHEAQYPGAAVPYRPEVDAMSDAECVAVNHLCCAGGYQCHACPFQSTGDEESKCFDIERRVLGMAEKYVEAARSPSPADGGSSLPEGASEADADGTNVGRKREWISVEERLPDNYRAVLVACEGLTIGGYAAIAIASYGGGFWSIADADGTMYLTKYMRCVVTHWMPLPEPPMMKGGADDGPSRAPAPTEKGENNENISD